MLIVLQAMDTGGKDGSIEHVFSGVNPQGCTVTSFKAPTPLELSHDFLWRIHDAVPAEGDDRHLQPLALRERAGRAGEEARARRRCGRSATTTSTTSSSMLSDEGVTILKFFLHISKDEQKKRLESR